METISLYDISIKQMTKMLENLSHFLEKSTQHAQAKKIEMDVFLQTRLIADQFPLVKQIQTACDSAKLCASRLSGKTAPVNEDTETTYDEIQKRIKSTVSYLKTITSADLKEYETKKIEFAFNKGKYLTGFDYVTQFAIPNFYFHLTTAYSILRANGVDVGKMDYMGELPYTS